MIVCLYKTTNLVNNNFYIGVHKSNDVNFGTKESKDDYLGSGKILKDAFKKYDRSNFLIEVIAYFDNEDDAYKAEQYIVTKDFIEREDTYNYVLGGNKPPKTTKESAAKSAITTRSLGKNKGHKRPDAKNYMSINNPMDNVEIRNKQRNNSIEWNMKTVTCPHCNKQGSNSGMQRWHFDRCKERKL